MLDKRRRIVPAVVLGSVLLTGAGVAAATVVKSPQQAVADAGPPPRDVLTAAVEHRVLTDTVVTRGRVAAAQTVDVSPAPAAADGAMGPVVTRTFVRPGDGVEAGQVLVEISGRPFFALPGDIPVYRDLRPGTSGEDVAQLQHALAQAGFPTGEDAEGTYGPGTARAVAGFYRDLGYAPVPDENGQALMPAAELVFLAGFPARVEAMTARVGAAPGEGALTLSAGDLAVEGTLAPHEYGLVRTGQQVEIHSETTGETATATVTHLAGHGPAPGPAPRPGEEPPPPGTGPATAAPDASGHWFRVHPDDPLPAALAGRNVRVTIEAASSAGEVLVVPVTAVSAGPDATTAVTVLREDGSRQRIEVRTGISGDGHLEVTPVGQERLEPGDRVIVGARQDGTGSGEPDR
ncbi:peptidoglycan-binding protein [Streptomyces sp. YIM 98790]|uniref:peptidoglycan-binding protein n=1 Tax=Streptomyces sp. YIM 98790 TaxID=2689077 RepID=UPI0028BF31F2|nr:peptidoglycan-binding protein [Streptomyces sp. YIM 98790]